MAFTGPSVHIGRVRKAVDTVIGLLSRDHELIPARKVLRQCKVPRAEAMFVIIQRENIHLSKKEMNKIVAMLKL
jgi:hypothetical protein